ncbi:tripartite tricarboxylate transporter substrate binding protein [Achromobacter sp. NFACC18-2]|uniref:Bug family tripartite tricarboxylate transporter substrate binding protein n=1 Tax=Achromobacter sp. NFACC18-2 TaxID=1564112 RepID=UPI0008C5A877|nr:tripartite tricarboxylate transporter substrate binding protein [Achromobacter sp. NFACC18-2]SEJ21553.1 Tripartite-type tricarboxylate transporter, receptor component TctC [Achromobacter sp. NFACC18-2]
MAHVCTSQPHRPAAATDRRHALRNLLFAALAATGLAAGPAQADDWPSKPIKIIVPYTPGGSTDTVTRIVMEKLGPRLNQTIVVENRPGANSSLGSALVAKAEPDGYTFLSMLPAYIINFHLYKLGYKPADLTPVVQMADLPLFLFVSQELPVNNVSELVAYARKNPDKLTYASSGNGSSAHLTGADFALQSKITMTHVAYKGSAPILTDLLGNRVSMVFDPILVPMQYVKQNRLKALAFTGKERWPTEPGIPTMEEAGLPGFVTGSWAGLMAPANTPRPIIERMAREISEIVKEPDVRQKFVDAGFLPVGGTPAQFAELMKKDSARYAEIIKQANITVN